MKNDWELQQNVVVVAVWQGGSFAIQQQGLFVQSYLEDGKRMIKSLISVINIKLKRKHLKLDLQP